MSQRPSGPPSPRKFLRLALALGALYLVINPPFAVNDEDVHLYRIFELSEGRLMTRSDSAGEYHEVPADYERWGRRLQGIPPREGGRVKWGTLATLWKAHRAKPPLVRSLARAAGYSPLSYHLMVPALWLARQLDVGVIWHIYLARLASLAVYAFLAQRSVSIAGRFGWLFFATGLMPMVLTQAAGVSIDGLVLGLALLYFALIAKGSLLDGPTLGRGELLQLTACLVLLTLTRPVYGVLGLSLGILRWEGPHARYARWGFAFVACATAALGYLLWRRAYSAVAPPDDNPGLSPSAQLALLRLDPARAWTLVWTSAFRFIDDLLLQSIFVRYRIAQGMRWAGGLASVLYAQLLLVLAWGSARAPAARTLRQRTWPALALFASALGVVFTVPAALYLCCVEVGAMELHGVHGRYLIPAFPALLLSLSLFGRPLLGRWLRLHGARIPMAVILFANLLCLFSLIGWHYVSPSVEWPL